MRVCAGGAPSGTDWQWALRDGTTLPRQFTAAFRCVYGPEHAEGEFFGPLAPEDIARRRCRVATIALGQ